MKNTPREVTRRKLLLGGMAGAMAVATGTVLSVTEGRAASVDVTDQSPLLDTLHRWQSVQGEIEIIEAEMDRLEAQWPIGIGRPCHLRDQIRELDSYLDDVWNVRAGIEDEIIAAPAKTIQCLHLKMQVLLRNWDCDAIIMGMIAKVADDAGVLTKTA